VAGFAALWVRADCSATSAITPASPRDSGWRLYFLWDLLHLQHGRWRWRHPDAHAAASPLRGDAARRASDVGIMLTANLISLTPGTLSVDVAGPAHAC
jgi:hypothetical protein